MIYQICQLCGRAIRGKGSDGLIAMMQFCQCKPYTPAMDRGDPNTAATEIQRLIDLVATRELVIATLKFDARERALEMLSDAARYQYTLEVKDAEIAKLATGRDLYEVVRRMSVPQFRETYCRSLYTHKKFNDLVADMAPHFGLTVRRCL